MLVSCIFFHNLKKSKIPVYWILLNDRFVSRPPRNSLFQKRQKLSTNVCLLSAFLSYHSKYHALSRALSFSIVSSSVFSGETDCSRTWNRQKRPIMFFNHWTRLFYGSLFFGIFSPYVLFRLDILNFWSECRFLGEKVKRLEGGHRPSRISIWSDLFLLRKSTGRVLEVGIPSIVSFPGLGDGRGC